MSEWLRKILNLKDIAQLYIEKSDNWLLLEVLETNSSNEPTKFGLLAFSPDKNKLHDYVSEDESWDWSKKYLMVFADPTKPCTIR